MNLPVKFDPRQLLANTNHASDVLRAARTVIEQDKTVAAAANFCIRRSELEAAASAAREHIRLVWVNDER